MTVSEAVFGLEPPDDSHVGVGIQTIGGEIEPP